MNYNTNEIGKWSLVAAMLIVSSILAMNTWYNIGDSRSVIDDFSQPEGVFLDSFYTGLKNDILQVDTPEHLLVMVISESPCPACLVEIDEYVKVADSMGVRSLIHVGGRDSLARERLIKMARFRTNVTKGRVISDGIFEDVPERLDTLAYMGMLYNKKESMVTGIVSIPYNFITPIGYKKSVLTFLRGQ